MFDDAISIATQSITVSPSLIAGITAQSGQIGLMLGLRGATTAAWGGMLGGTYPTAASFYAGCVNLNFQHQNMFPIRGQVFLGAGAGATVVVDVTRFFR